MNERSAAFLPSCYVTTLYEEGALNDRDVGREVETINLTFESESN